jgi:Ca2+-dependent lipid-binding protein
MISQVAIGLILQRVKKLKFSKKIFVVTDGAARIEGRIESSKLREQKLVREQAQSFEL